MNQLILPGRTRLQLFGTILSAIVILTHDPKLMTGAVDSFARTGLLRRRVGEQNIR
jgi:hypothetical protein